jgi:asparagine synthase (glutamine-hydrolysing)
MRRALVGIVPDEILNRKRKAFASRAPLVHISKDWASLVEMTQHMVTSSLGVVDPRCFLDALQRARRGEETAIVPLIRTIWIEDWLSSLRRLGNFRFET